MYLKNHPELLDYVGLDGRAATATFRMILESHLTWTSFQLFSESFSVSSSQSNFKILFSVRTKIAFDGGQYTFQ